jgi:hypothetical protein
VKREYKKILTASELRAVGVSREIIVRRIRRIEEDPPGARQKFAHSLTRSTVDNESTGGERIV